MTWVPDIYLTPLVTSTLITWVRWFNGGFFYGKFLIPPNSIIWNQDTVKFTANEGVLRLIFWRKKYLLCHLEFCCKESVSLVADFYFYPIALFLLVFFVSPLPPSLGSLNDFYDSFLTPLLIYFFKILFIYLRDSEWEHE